MKSVLRRLLFFALGGLLALALLFVYAFVKRDALLKAILAQWNEELNIQVKTERIGLEFSAFPQLTVTLQPFFVASAFNAEDTLLYASVVKAKVPLLAWLKSNYTIKSISAEQGVVHIKYDLNGKANFELLPKSTKPSPIINLQNLELQNFVFSYTNPLNKQFVKGNLSSLNLKGQVVSMEDLSVTTEAKIWALNFDGNTLKDLPIKSKAHYYKELWEIWVQSSGMFEAEYVQKPKGSHLTATIFKVERLLNQPIAAKILKPHLKHAKGALDVKLVIDENLNELEGEVNCKELILELDKQQPFKAMGRIQFHKLKKDIQLTFNQFTLEQSGNSAICTGQYLYQKLPKLNLQAEIQIKNWAFLQTNFPDLDFQITKGEAFAEVQYNGPVQKASDFKNAKVVLDVKGLDIAGHTRITDLNGRCLWQNKRVDLENILAKVDNHELFVQGYGDFNGPKPDWNLKIRSSTLSFFQTPSASASPNSRLLSIPPLNAHVIFEVDALKLGKMVWEEVRFAADLQEGNLKVERFFGRAFGGNISGSASLNANLEGFDMQVHAELQNIGMKAMMKGFENFGQNTLVHEQLEGQLSGKLEVKGMVTPQGALSLSSLYAKADCLLENGRLIRFSPLQSLSAVADEKALNDLRLEKHHQVIEIAHNKLIIPSTQIKTNAFEMLIEGEHGFDSYIDYRVVIPIQDLITKKRKRSHEFDAWLVEAQTRKRPNLHIQIKGSMDAPQIELDKTGLKESLRQEWKEQFKKEEKRDSIKRPAFEYEWEEDGG